MNSKKIEVPSFMSPPQAVDNLQQRLDGYVIKLRQTACSNAVITAKPASYDKKTKLVDPGDVLFKKDACKNQRRNGSKYCQDCSDKHHGIKKPVILTDEHMRPGMEVEAHLRKYGHLPSLGCCEHDQPDTTTCHKIDESKPETCPSNCKTHGIPTNNKK